MIPGPSKPLSRHKNFENRPLNNDFMIFFTVQCQSYNLVVFWGCCAGKGFRRLW